MTEPRICEPGGSGMLFPLYEAEQHWSDTVRAVMYIAALFYIFLGVNIVADKFVASIEVITSSKKRVRQKSTGRIVTVAVWNGTMANLTLMALGSSAPEILLSVIETVSGDFHSGALGPGVIVGSAAFNLFLIIAVCIYAIPSPDTRSIKEYSVFVVTAVFSLLAYAWLVIICSVSSPDVIDLWEALVTLMMMPVLLVVSYVADIGYLEGKKQPTTFKYHNQPLRLEDNLSAPVSALGRHDLALNGTPPWGFGAAPALEPRNPAGILAFPATTWELAAGFEERNVHVPVLRMDGLEGSVSCKYHTEGRSAVPGYDFVASEGVLDFGPGEERSYVALRLLPKRLGEHSDMFQVVLEDAAGGASFDPEGDGGEARSVLTITIRNENEDLTRLSGAMRCCVMLDGMLNMDHLRFALATWREEVKASVLEVGGDDDDEGEGSGGEADAEGAGRAEPSGADYFMHTISVPWKLPFALLIPPAAVAGGWPCFAMALVFIGGLTCWVIDFAELFGCVTGIQDEITAITLVALGTSMPDLFASKAAACQDEWADASIVNVTGSNSVNVFLGIGVPWAMSAIYWKVVGASDSWKKKYSDFAAANPQVPQGAFIVRSGDLAFGVIVFTLAAFVALALLRFRRLKFGGELGGPQMPKVMSALLMVCLWLFYICLSIWKITAGQASLGTQLFAIFLAVCILENILLVLGVAAYVLGSRKRLEEPREDLEAFARAPSEAGGEDIFAAPAAPMPADELLAEPPAPARARAGAAVSVAPVGLRQAACAGRGLPTQLGVQNPTVYGCPTRGPAPHVASRCGVLSFTNAAMVCLAVKRFKAQVVERRAFRSFRDVPLLEPYSTAQAAPWDSQRQTPELQRENSFQSLDDTASIASSTSFDSRPQPQPRRSVAGRVVDYVGRNAVDWAALGAAGLAAAQVVDMQAGGGAMG